MNIENLGVQEMSAQEARIIEGGSWLSRNWEACVGFVVMVGAAIAQIGSNVK